VGSLSTRALNRALLERQLLLHRTRMPVLRALETLVGMQAQVPSNPYTSLWSRLDGFDPAQLSAAIEKRRAVRLTLLRATIHLVTARDALSMRAALQPALEQTFRTGTPFARKLDGVDLATLAETGRRLVSSEPRTLTDLRAALADRWPGYDVDSLAYAVHYLVPQVQLPPRGLWGGAGIARWMSLESWLGRPLDDDASPEPLIRRYLAAFGPSTVADASAWSGMRAMREILDRMRPTLRTFKDERGRELFDVPRAALPSGDVDAPPRFLPDYDNVLLAHADRTRVMSEEIKKQGVIGKPTLLVDGFVRGTWTLARERGKVTLSVSVFKKLTSVERVAVTQEGESLLAFLAADVEDRRVRISNA
jgi:Winged helix DNA-binding domain